MTQTNPLLDPLGPHRSLPEWPALLEHNPLADFPEDPTDAQREEYLYKIKDRFAVTRTALDVAFDIQYMLRSGYSERNPCDPANQRKRCAIADLEGTFTTKSPMFYTDTLCKLVMGITGMGKSQIIRRVLETYDQVAVHGANETAQWLKHTQIVHLTVKMPADGSRGGLLYAILLAIDGAVNTDYFNEYNKRSMTIEKLILKCAQLLALYSVGILVVEEMQDKNFISSKHGEDLKPFFLGLFSFGIPLVLVGNPLAFEETDEHTQTQRRFLSIEPVELWPYESSEDPEWCQAIAPAIWAYQVVDEAQPFDQNVAESLWRCSGGIPGYARKLVHEIQMSILKRRASELSTETMEIHYRDLASFARFRSIIEGLTQRDGELISAHDDIPVERFKECWKSRSKQTARGGATTTEPTGAASEASVSDTQRWSNYRSGVERNKKAATTRKANKKKKNQDTEDSADVGDLRHGDSAKASLSRKLAELRKELEEDS